MQNILMLYGKEFNKESRRVSEQLFTQGVTQKQYEKDGGG